MKKQITQQRIINAIEKIDRALQNNREFKKYSAIVESLTLKGLQSRFNCENRLDDKKLKLELTYGDIISKQDFGAVWQNYYNCIDRFHKKREKVWAIQRTNNISGLVFHKFNFNCKFTFPWVSENLKLQRPDLKILEEWKPKVIEHWFDTVLLKGSIVYLLKDREWHESSIQEMQAAAPFYQWANSYGCADELHLVLGNGLDVESCESDSISFCAITPRFPPPCQ